ncbi:MAG TPA: T9SS type A sorting domain-containing protein, partial [Rhodothermales bacterium]|nr:T9SS type A sorting domain-containing protein [Rhodothermales bacterium]
VSALAQAPSAPNVFYAGTGEGMGNVDAISGSGVFKSTDGGTTWALLPATTRGAFRAVNRLVVSPVTPGIVVAATPSGIMQTLDGGDTWRQVLTDNVQQVVAAPSFVLYAAARGHCGRRESPRLYRSTTSGSTWAPLGDALTMPSGGGRAELAVAPSAPQRVYASVEGCDGRSHLFVSRDDGGHWHEVAFSDPATWLGEQGWFANTLVVSPTNPDLVFLGGLDLYRATLSGVDSGQPRAALSQISSWTAKPDFAPPWAPQDPWTYVHADQHAMVTVLSSSGTWSLVTATDGGVFATDTPGSTRPGWGAVNSGLTTGQFYGADLHPVTNFVVGGLQDNGTWAGYTEMAPGPWTHVGNGDGFDAVVNDRGWYIMSAQFSLLTRVTGGASGQRVITPLTSFGDQGRGPFMTTIARPDGDREQLFVPGPQGVWRSDDFGMHWACGAFRTRVAEGVDLWGNAGARIVAAVSAPDPRIVWAGARVSAHGRLFVSHDGGATFDTTRAPAEVYRPGDPDHAGALLSGLATHPHEPRTAYALFSAPGYPKVLKTTDLGQTWTSLSGTFREGQSLSSNGFPDVAVYSLLVMPFAPDVLWAGTEIGLFVSEDGGRTWAKDTSGLPPVSVWQMRIAGDRIVVATHGRGVWTVQRPELTFYRPVTVKAPALYMVMQSYLGPLSLSGAVRTALDSLHVMFDERVVRRFGSLTAGAPITLPSVHYPIRDGISQVRLVGYLAAKPYGSGLLSVEYAAAPAPLTHASLDFSNGIPADMTAGGLEAKAVTGFGSPALHTAHPIPPYTTTAPRVEWRRPVRVTGDTRLRYRDVLLTPDCVANAGGCMPSPTTGVVHVEGSVDGWTWTTLLPAYATRSQPAWAAAMQAGEPGREALMVWHEVNVGSYFPEGEVVFLRIRLERTYGSEGWGWALDDMYIAGGATAAEPPAATVGVDLRPPAPNPATGPVTLTAVLSAPAAVSLRVFDVRGRLVATLHEGLLPSGTSRIPLDAGPLPPGVYLVQLVSGAERRTHPLTVTR